MRVVWDGNRPLADRSAIASLYQVSMASVRRHCEPVRYEPGTGAALYDAYAAAEQLATIVPRPDRTRIAERIRQATAHTRTGGPR
jgi:hypothetical protein